MKVHMYEKSEPDRGVVQPNEWMNEQMDLDVARRTKMLDKSIAFAFNDGVTRAMRRFLGFEELVCANYCNVFLGFSLFSLRCEQNV